MVKRGDYLDDFSLLIVSKDPGKESSLSQQLSSSSLACVDRQRESRVESDAFTTA